MKDGDTVVGPSVRGTEDTPNSVILRDRPLISFPSPTQDP